jgi:plasmid stability protein
MAQLVIPDIEETTLQRLRERAEARGTTAEAEARVVLTEALQSASCALHRSAQRPLDVSARLEELRTLQDGWLDGTGVAPAAKGLDWLAAAWKQFYAPDVEPPHLYPTPAGGIRAEWSLGTQEASLEIGLPDHSAQWHALDLETDQADSLALDLDRPSDWEWLSDRIRGLSKAAQ